MNCLQCFPLAEEVASLNRLVLELDGQVKRLPVRERELSTALCQVPRRKEYRSTVYREGF